MSVSASPAPFPFEAALRDSLEIFQKNGAIFVVVMLIGTTPRFLGDLLMVMSLRLALFAMLLMLVGIVSSILAGATVQTAVLTGSTDVNSSMSSVTPRLLPLIGLGFVIGIAVVVGLVLLVVPGVIAACALIAAVPIFLDQNTAVIDSLQRSVDMTKGNWLRIFFMLAIYGIVAGIAFVIITKVFGLILGGFGTALATWLVGSVVSAFGQVLVVVTYRKLRGGYA